MGGWSSRYIPCNINPPYERLITITELFGFLVCITRGPEATFGVDFVAIIRSTIGPLMLELILTVSEDPESVNLKTFVADSSIFMSMVEIWKGVAGLSSALDLPLLLRNLSYFSLYIVTSVIYISFPLKGLLSANTLYTSPSSSIFLKHYWRVEETMVQSCSHLLPSRML